MWSVTNWVLSLVEITAFRLERKSCKGFFWKINFPQIRALKFLTVHVIFDLCYNQIYQLKTTVVTVKFKVEISQNFVAFSEYMNCNYFFSFFSSSVAICSDIFPSRFSKKCWFPSSQNVFSWSILCNTLGPKHHMSCLWFGPQYSIWGKLSNCRWIRYNVHEFYFLTLKYPGEGGVRKSPAIFKFFNIQISRVFCPNPPLDHKIFFANVEKKDKSSKIFKNSFSPPFSKRIPIYDFNTKKWLFWAFFLKCTTFMNQLWSSKIADFIIFIELFFACTLHFGTSRGRNFNLIDLNRVSNFSCRRQLSNEILFGGLERKLGGVRLCFPKWIDSTDKKARVF